MSTLTLKTNQNKPSTDYEASIPSKLYFSIGEASQFCKLKPHVLRYWEQEFTQLKPLKRRGNRRYYQRKDVLLVCQIKSLLYEQGFTIEGAKAQLLGTKSNNSLQITACIKRTVTYLEEVLTILEATE